MKVDCLILGAYETNCYVLRSDEAAKDCLIIDTGLEARKLLDFLEREQLNPKAVVLTHGHADHISGVSALKEKYPAIKSYIHKLDFKMLSDSMMNLSIFGGSNLRIEEDGFTVVEDSDIIEHDAIKLKVFHTPGHTQGGICLYLADEKTIFVGDTLFADSVGRTDLPGGSMSELMASIKNKLLILPDETIVYTGHGPATTMGREKAHNQYLQ